MIGATRYDNTCKVYSSRVTPGTAGDAPHTDTIKYSDVPCRIRQATSQEMILAGYVGTNQVNSIRVPNGYEVFVTDIIIPDNDLTPNSQPVVLYVHNVKAPQNSRHPILIIAGLKN